MHDDPNATCPVARALDLIGDRWSLLIVRDAFDGVHRFSDFQRSLGMSRSMLSQRLQALLGREAARAGQASQAAAPLPSRGSPAYDALVRRLYADTPLPGKPRNALGMVKELPVAEMEAALLATTHQVVYYKE